MDTTSIFIFCIVYFSFIGIHYNIHRNVPVSFDRNGRHHRPHSIMIVLFLSFAKQTAVVLTGLTDVKVNAQQFRKKRDNELNFVKRYLESLLT
ncbi:hypothetical protein BD408DRAFT_118084 [Parasitella parasitica]|nr:hypothetical protein BD408DRAFT_118084 [Parasitella parasitica]